MMHLLIGDDKNLADWISRQVGQDIGLSKAIGLVEGSEERRPVLVCAVAYNRYVGHDISMSIAATSPKWANRRTIAAFFAYPFLQLGVSRVTCMAAADNADSISTMSRLGFMYEGRLRRGFDGERDAVIYGMLREECHWLTKPPAIPLGTLHISQIESLCEPQVVALEAMPIGVNAPMLH